jgi:hypothetical protein
MQWDKMTELVSWHKVAEGTTYHLLGMLAVSALTLTGAWLLRKLHAARYGCLLNVRVCIVDPLETLKVHSFSSEVIWEGQASDFVHDLSAAGSLVRAVRKTKVAGPMTLRGDDAGKILSLCANQIRQQFASGYVAKAMDDEGVTTRAFRMGLIKDPEGTSPATLLLVTMNDWKLLQDEPDKVRASGDDQRVKDWARSLGEETSIGIRMFM